MNTLTRIGNFNDAYLALFSDQNINGNQFPKKTTSFNFFNPKKFQSMHFNFKEEQIFLYINVL